jgi:hypothetical protein
MALGGYLKSKIVCRCTAPCGLTPPAPLDASHDYKARIPLSLSRLCTANTPSVLIYFVTLSRPPTTP